MSLQSHLAELERRHHALETAIERELIHPGMDDIKLCSMKKQKLKLKDEIQRLKPSSEISASVH